MYRQDCTLIAEFGNSSPEGLLNVATFVLATIQTPISRAATVAEDMRIRGVKSKYLNVSKRRALEHLTRRKKSLYNKLQSAETVNEVVEHIIQVPGLGVVKASFVAQLLGWEVGCIDRHNLILYNVKPNTVNIPPSLTQATRQRKIADYVAACEQIGGSEFLWNSWCDHVAGTKWNKRLPTAEDVSREHIIGVGL